MMTRSEVNFNVSNVVMEDDKISNETIKDHKDTFNMFFGTSNKDIDLFNNGFIQPNIYEIDQQYKAKRS